jgi:peroxiredoxin
MQPESLAINAPMPAFADLPDISGARRSAKDFLPAKVLIVVFSCNHCPYVQAYEDRMMAFQKEYAQRGVRLIAINSNETQNYPEDNFEEMVRRAAMKQFNFPYLRDDDQRVAEAFGATHTPEFFAFEVKQDRTALRYHGKMDDNYRSPAGVKRHYLREAVDAILAGDPVKEPETHSIGCTIKWR